MTNNSKCGLYWKCQLDGHISSWVKLKSSASWFSRIIHSYLDRIAEGTNSIHRFRFYANNPSSTSSHQPDVIELRYIFFHYLTSIVNLGIRVLIVFRTDIKKSINEVSSSDSPGNDFGRLLYKLQWTERTLHTIFELSVLTKQSYFG